MKTHTSRNLDQREAARRVVSVINQILCHWFWKIRIEPKMPPDEDFRPAYVPIHNATVESSLISIRMLNEVFAPEKRYPDDLHQSDFPGFNQDRPFLTDE